MAQNTEAQTLDDTLNKTNFGQVINENKKPILVVGALVVLGIIAFSIYRYQTNQQESQRLNEIYSFQSKVVEPFLDGKIKSQEVVEKVLSLNPELTGSPSLAPAIFEVANKLVAQEKAVEAVSILEKWLKQFSPGSYFYLFTSLRLAPLYENTNQPAKAIEIYESLVKADYELLQGKIFLDLGRLYLAQGQVEKAKSHLEHVTKNHDSTEYAKFARLYLQKIPNQK